MLKLNMMDDRIAVKNDVASEVSEGGIIIPTTSKKPVVTIEGTVVAVGPGKRNHQNWKERIQMELKVGMRVAFSPYVGAIAKIDGLEYTVMKEEDVIAILPAKA